MDLKTDATATIALELNIEGTQISDEDAGRWEEIDLVLECALYADD
jgi:hypothetical protein